WDTLTEKYVALEYLFLNLAQLSPKHYDFISQFATITLPLSEKYYQRISVVLKIPSYYEWLNANRELESLLPTFVWHHWDCIVSIYLAPKDKNKILSPDNQDNIFEQWRI